MVGKWFGVTSPLALMLRTAEGRIALSAFILQPAQSVPIRVLHVLPDLEEFLAFLAVLGRARCSFCNVWRGNARAMTEFTLLAGELSIVGTPTETFLTRVTAR